MPLFLLWLLWTNVLQPRFAAGKVQVCLGSVTELDAVVSGKLDCIFIRVATAFQAAAETSYY